MRDPVICCDGFSYEEENIKQWIEQERGGRVLSPMTGVPLANLSLTKNHVLRQAIEAFTEGLLQASQPADAQGKTEDDDDDRSLHSARMLLGLSEQPSRAEVRMAFHEQAQKLAGLRAGGSMRRLCDAYLRLTTGHRPLVADSSGLVYLLLAEATLAEKERNEHARRAVRCPKPAFALSPRSALSPKSAGPASGGAMMSLAVGGVRAEITADAVTGVNELGVACGLFDSYDAFQAAASAVLSAFLVTTVSFAEVQASLLLGSGTERLCTEDLVLGASMSGLQQVTGLRLHLRPTDALAYAECEQQRDRQLRRIVMLNVAREQAYLLRPLHQPGTSFGLVESAVGPRQPNLVVPAASVASAQLTPVFNLEPESAGWRQLRRLTMGVGVGLPISEAFLLFFQAVSRPE